MKRYWVIPDIHGNSKTLRALIEEQIKPIRSDWLCFLGDYIDRGPDAKGVIDYIMKLQEDEYDVIPLRGNHEDFLLRTYDNETVQKNIMGITFRNKMKKEWFRFGGRETLKSFGVLDVHDIPGKYIDWMRNLEYYFQLDGYVLVHAGLNFSIENPYDDKHAMLWAKDFKAIPEKIDNRKVVHGHVPVSLDFIDLLAKSDAFHFIDLDNGVYMPGKEGFGNLVAMELTSRELIIQPNLDMD